MIWHQLDQELDVWREGLSPDGSGGRRKQWACTGSVWAMVSQPQARERVLAQQAGSRHDHIVHLAPDADVRRSDRLRYHVAEPGSVNPDAKPYFRVISVIRPSKSDVYLRAECELIQAEGS